MLYTDTRTDAEKAADLEIQQLRAERDADPEADYAGMLEDRLARVYRELYKREGEGE